MRGSMAAAVAALVRGRRMWMGVGMGIMMVMEIGGGIARVVVRCRVPGFRDGGPLGLGKEEFLRVQGMAGVLWDWDRDWRFWFQPWRWWNL